jgi:hypothetical protein
MTEVPNKLPNNRYNSVHLEDGVIVKRGPAALLEGEIFYYTALQRAPAPLRAYFPAFYGASTDAKTAALHLEYIQGLPGYTLFKTGALTPAHVDTLFACLDVLHGAKGTTELSATAIAAAYAAKLEERFTVAEDYDFVGGPALQTKIREIAAGLPPPVVAAYIHGDYWLSNILFPSDAGGLKALDMRGRIGRTLTTCGDIYYDYAKLYQSFLGYDAVLYGDSIDASQLAFMQSLFEAQIVRRDLDMAHVRGLCFVLMASSFGFMGYDEGRKARMGAWLLGLLGC